MNFKSQIMVLLVALSVLYSFVSTSQETKTDINANLDEEEELKTSYVVENGKLFVVTGEKRREIELEARALSADVEADKLYVAIGEAGLLVFDIKDKKTPRLLKHVPVSHGSVNGIVKVSNDIWMKVDTTTAVLISGTGIEAKRPDTKVSPLISPAPAKVTAENKTADSKPESDASDIGKEAQFYEPVSIVAIYPGKVKLNGGRNAGLKAGDLLKITREIDIKGLGDSDFTGKAIKAFLLIEAVADTYSIAHVWRGDRVKMDDHVVKAKKDEEPSISYPRHLTYLGEVSGAFRPIFNIGNKGFGILSDLSLSIWGKKMFVNLRMSPLGIGVTDSHTLVTNSLLAETGYNSRAFAFGMGLGFSSVNGNMSSMMISSVPMRFEDGSSEKNEEKWEKRTKHAFAVSQVVRIGAMDGCNLNIYNILLYNSDADDDDNEETQNGFTFGGAYGRLIIPIALKADLFFESGGGIVGYWHSAVGVFTWIRGNGDKGSIGFSVAVGWAGLFGKIKEVNNDYSFEKRIVLTGPMFSLGFKGRFKMGK